MALKRSMWMLACAAAALPTSARAQGLLPDVGTQSLPVGAEPLPSASAPAQPTEIDRLAPAADLDGDGIPNRDDPDRDGDGIGDGIDPDPTLPSVLVGRGRPPATLPPPASDSDPTPPASSPVIPVAGIVSQAGVGGTQAYARVGVLELGGSFGFTSATGFTQLNVSPQVGWFVIDNLQLSAIAAFGYIDAGEQSGAYLTLIGEPSLHVPMTDRLFGFAGLGAGLAYTEGPGAGLALVPRAGINVMIGRSGVLTPALQVLWSTNADDTEIGVGMNVGFSAMW